jgi:hypothetical protein
VPEAGAQKGEQAAVCQPPLRLLEPLGELVDPELPAPGPGQRLQVRHQLLDVLRLDRIILSSSTMHQIKKNKLIYDFMFLICLANLFDFGFIHVKNKFKGVQAREFWFRISYTVKAFLSERLAVWKEIYFL